MPHRILRVDQHLIFGLFTLGVMVCAVKAVDNTGLLAKSLFTFQNHACAKETLVLRCPFGTTIRVQWAKYGRRARSAQMCGTFDMMEKEGAGSADETGFREDTNCVAKTSLEVVLQKCQDRRTCKLVAAAAEFGEDPCPGTSKYLEVAYKCRPNEFRSRITCEHDDLLLRCKKSRRIAVYSAVFGRSRRGNLECPASGGFDGECKSVCSLDVVSKKCHGKRRCTITASTATFGDPCDPGTKKYLSVIYTCVPKRILKEMKNNNGDAYPNSFCSEDSPNTNDNAKKGREDSAGGSREGGAPETETPSDGIPPTRRDGRRRPSTTTQPTKVAKGEADRIPEVGPEVGLPTQRVSTVRYEVVTVESHKPATRGGSKPPENQSEQGLPEADTTEPCVTPDGEVSAVREDYVGFVTDWIYTVTFIEDNLEKFILYVILGLFLGLILLLLTIIIRMAQTKRRKKRKANLNISEPVPNSSAHTEDLELLSDSDRTDGIEILSINHNNRPPPFRTDTGNRSMSSGYYG